MNYYSYKRCSTQSQMEKNGLEMQEEEIARYCIENEIILSGEFSDEGVSGTDQDRDGLIGLLSSLEDGDKVVVQNTSRLWRNDSVKVLVHHELRKIHADIISIEQPSYTIYESDPSNFLFNGMMELLDQYERMTISMKLSKGRKARAKSGNKPCGTAPYGYKWQDNEIVIDYNNNLIIKDIFSKYIELRSLEKLKKYCDDTGYKTSTGRQFSKQALKNILNNDFYIGIVTYAGKKVNGNHDKIIDKTTFENANSTLKR